MVRIALLLLLALFAVEANAFAVKCNVQALTYPCVQGQECLSLGSKQHTKLSLLDDEKSFDDGSQRGIPLLLGSLMISVWFFSIPVEFRRAHWCFSERCEQNRSFALCNDCVTFGEWKEGVLDYYRNGGGVQWDFSIDPNSKLKL